MAHMEQFSPKAAAVVALAGLISPATVQLMRGRVRRDGVTIRFLRNAAHGGVAVEISELAGPRATLERYARTWPCDVLIGPSLKHFEVRDRPVAPRPEMTGFRLEVRPDRPGALLGYEAIAERLGVTVTTHGRVDDLMVEANAPALLEFELAADDAGSLGRIHDAWVRHAQNLGHTLVLLKAEWRVVAVA